MGIFSRAKSSASSVSRGYIVLNVIRFCNIVCLLSCVASSGVMLVKTFNVNKFFFFDGTSHVFTGLLAIFLIITETSLFRKYFMHNWPLLSVSSGFVTLGVLMVVIGTLILGNLNKEATSEQSLGTSFWQLVISSGIITCIFGLINMLVNFMFRKRKLNISARMVRAYGASADQHVADIYASGPANRGADAYNDWHEKTMVPTQQSSYEDMRTYVNETNNLDYNNGLNRGLSASQAPSMARKPSVAASDMPSYYGSGPSRVPSTLRKAPSVVMSEIGGNPYARSVSPLSASTGNTKWPSSNRRSISAPVAFDPEQFKKFANAHDIPRPADAAHPALRGDQQDNWV